MLKDNIVQLWKLRNFTQQTQGGQLCQDRAAAIFGEYLEFTFLMYTYI